jgi:hypothetical protein
MREQLHRGRPIARISLQTPFQKRSRLIPESDKEISKRHEDNSSHD